MTREYLATCTMSMPSGAPDKVHLLPFGTVRGRDGRGPYTLRDKAHAAKVIAASRDYQRGADMPVDYEHQSQLAPPHVLPRPAAGWLKADGLEIGPNGIWGRVEWTATASAMLDDRAYRYLSPVFNHAEDGTVLRIVGAALTNFPNLELTALASQGASMAPDTLTSAKALLGLESADDQTFLQTCGDLAKLVKAFVTRLGLPPETSPAGLMAALMEKAGGVQATASQTDDLAATIQAVQAVASQAEILRRQVSQAQVDTMVSAAMQAGKVSPGMKPWAMALASQAPDSFAEFLATMPPIFGHIVNPTPLPGQIRPNRDGNTAGLTSGQLAVCSRMGIAPEDYAKNLKG